MPSPKKEYFTTSRHLAQLWVTEMRLSPSPVDAFECLIDHVREDARLEEASWLVREASSHHCPEAVLQYMRRRLQVHVDRCDQRAGFEALLHQHAPRKPGRPRRRISIAVGA